MFPFFHLPVPHFLVRFLRDLRALRRLAYTKGTNRFSARGGGRAGEAMVGGMAAPGACGVVADHQPG
jgi:hypothetical protein